MIMQEYDEYFHDYYEFLKEERNKFENALNLYKENCIVSFDEIKELDIMNFNDGYFYHIGYCTVIKHEYKNGKKPTREIFEVKDCENELKEEIEDLLFEKQWETDNFYILLYQVEGYREDYSGYILFPMKNNKYWVVNFNNL